MTLLHSERLKDHTDLHPEVWASLFSSPTGFMKTVSYRKTGTTKGGKNWSRFQEQSVTFYSMKSGKLKVYYKERDVPRDAHGRISGRSRMGPIRDRTALTIDHSVLCDSKTLMDMGANHLGFESFDSLVEKEFPLNHVLKLSASGVLAPSRTESLVEASRLFMGKNYQKSIPRALAEVDGLFSKNIRAGFIQTAMAFQGIVPTDWIPDLFTPYTSNDILFQDREGLRALRRFLRTGTQTQLRRLTRNPPERFQQVLRDTLRNTDTLEGVDFRNLADLHDRAWEIGHVVNTPRDNTPIEYNDKAEEFLGSFGVYSVVAPSSTAELYKWSSTMGNCISGYGTLAAEGSTLLYAVMKGNSMVANMEVNPTNGDIKQLLGKYNQTLDKSLSDKVKSRVLSVWPNANVNSGWE